MKQYQIILLLFYFSKVSGYGYVTDTITVDPCADYWELSYKHPYLEQADSLWEYEKFDRAVVFYQQAVLKFEKEQNWKGLLKARNRIADNYLIAYQSDTAVSILEQNLKIISEHLNSNLVDLAEVYFLIGRSYDWGRKFDQALAAYNKALEIRLELYGEYHIDVAWEYIAMGDMFWYNDQNLNALKQLYKAVDVLMQAGCRNSQELGDTYYRLAATYRALKDLDKAEIYGLRALSIFKDNFSKRARCYNLLANVNEDKNEFEQSLNYNHKAIHVLLNHQPLSNSQQRNLANFLHSVANVHMENQRYDSSHIYFQRSLKVYDDLEDQDEVLLVYQNIGANYYLLNQYDSADYYLSKAIGMRKQIYGEKHFRTSSSLHAKGNFYENIGQLDSALHYYQHAIVAGSGQEFNSYQPATNPLGESLTYDDDGSLLNALHHKGAVLKMIYIQDQNPSNLELALETLLLALKLMDSNQKLYQLEGSTLFMAEDYYNVFEDALNVCYTLYGLTDNRRYLEKAFFIMEKSKARVLFDSFSDLQKNQLAGIPDSLVKVENSIKSRLASFSRDLENAKKQDAVNNQDIRKLEDKVFEATVELENFKKALESSYPSYASAIKNEPLDINSIQNKISKENKILVDYFWGDSVLFSLVLQDEQISFFRQSIDTIKQLVRNYQQHLLVGPQFTNQAARFKEFFENAYALYNILFKGINLEEKPLIIAADGPLRFIPFEGLVVEKPASGIQGYDQLKYVVHYYPTSYSYSANLWAMQPGRVPKVPQTLGFSHSGLDQEELEDTNELPGTAREIDVLKSQMEGRFFSGMKATKQNFLDHAQNYDIIHLAIHGISDSVSRLNNRLLFRSPDDQGQLDPMYTYELYNLRLNSELAVLSACESGIGRNYQGEGVYSMSRAFSYAGCPTTVMSLWRISDKTTPEILEQFYRQISKGKDIDQALRTAKLSYLSEHSGNSAHPFYWAAMVVHGDTDRVMKRSWTVWIISTLTILLLFVLVLKNR